MVVIIYRIFNIYETSKYVQCNLEGFMAANEGRNLRNEHDVKAVKN